MSEDKKDTAPAQAAPDLLKNMKAEFDRKISNLEATNKKLLDHVASMQRPSAPATTKKSLDEVWFDSPEQAAAEIESRVMNKIDSVSKQNNTVAQLVQEFPELADANSDLYKRAVEIFGGYSAEEKTSPVAYKAAVREAAQELEVKPASKRRNVDSDDDFALSGAGSGRARSESRGKRDVLDPRTEEFARLVGLNPDDAKTRENLKAHQKRTFKHYGK